MMINGVELIKCPKCNREVWLLNFNIIESHVVKGHIIGKICEMSGEKFK